MVEADCFKVPEGSINRVVLILCGRSAIVWEKIGQHALADVLGKSVKNEASHFWTARCQGETGQANHGVTAPVPKPVVTSDDGFTVRVLYHWTVNDELVSGEYQVVH